MERRPRALPVFLIAGLIAVAVTALPLFSSTSAAPATQVQYTRSTKINVPGVIKMFMHGVGAETRQTTTIGPERIRTDNGSDDTSYIVQCDLKRIVHLDNKAKTYWVKTFDQAQRDMDAALKAMAQKFKMASPAPQPTGSPIQGKGTVTVDFNEQPDDQTQVIAGLTAHHVLDTVKLKFAGTGDCAGSGELDFRSDEWYVKNELPSPTCPNAPKMTVPQGGPPMPQGQGSPCMSFQSAANSRTHPVDRFILKEDSSFGAGGHFGFSTHDEVTSYQTTPYDPKFLDVPAGYTQVQPPPMTQ